MKILLTGGTGFIGSNIAKTLSGQGFKVYATYRNTSSFEKCGEFKDKITWISVDQQDWKEEIKTIEPDQLVHVAWGGTDFENRNDWGNQIRNFWVSKEFFDLAKECHIKKVIALGSQAEYGTHDFPVNEMTLPVPDDAYGAIKTLTANYLRTLFENSSTEWYWLRIYSVFGEGENQRWLIPSVISKLLKNEPIKLTSCKQRYNYLYIEDFTSYLLSIIKCRENKSGIYNICNLESIVLKDLLILITELMDVSPDLLRFGEINQRHGQTMIISGNNEKFMASFNIKEHNPIGLKDGLLRTINYYKNLA